MHHIKIVWQQQVFPIWQLPQPNFAAKNSWPTILPTLPFIACGMLSWPDIFHLLQLLQDLFCTELSGRITIFTIAIKSQASPPSMCRWKKTTVTKVTNLTP